MFASSESPRLRLILVASIVLSLQCKCHALDDDNIAAAAAAGAEINGEQHAAPEPYSFSFSSDSIGATSLREETGDANGRVSGFYTLIGDDGRERRVDYVADENGYRASISTNEIGTRSESSADAQFNSRPPSEQQLQQAKISAEEYKYLEDTHQAERQRHLAQLSGNQNNQESRQQWKQTSLANNAKQVTRQQQQAYLQQTQANLGQQQQQQQPNIEYIAQPQQQFAQRVTTSKPEVVPSQLLPIDENADWRFRQFNNSSNLNGSDNNYSRLAFNTNQRQVDRGSQLLMDKQISNSNKMWQRTTNNAAAAAATTNNNNNRDSQLERQVKQQFMQQASALTNEDYPRQKQQYSSPMWNNNIGLQQQQPLINVDYSQTSQQQNNIIDEVVNQPEQIIAIPNVGQMFDQEKQTNQFGVGANKFMNNQFQSTYTQPQPQQQPLIPTQTQTTTTTTTSTTTPKPNAPSGFMAINLQETTSGDQSTGGDGDDENQTDENENNMKQQQEVATINEAQRPQPQQQQLQFQQFQGPNSIKQVIQEAQQKPQVAQQVDYETTDYQKRPFQTTFRPIVTTTKTPIYSSSVDTTPAPVAQIVDQLATTARAPFKQEIYFTTSIPTTTTTTSSTVRPILQRITTTQSSILSSESTTAFLSSTTRKPTYFASTKTNTNQVKNNQFGALLRKNYTHAYNRVQQTNSATGSSSVGQWKPEVAVQKVPLSTTTSVDAVASIGTVGEEQKRPQQQQQQQQQVIAMVPFKAPQGQIGYLNQQTSGFAQQTTLRPTVLKQMTENTINKQQQQQWNGAVKGGSKQSGPKRQFWQNQQQANANANTNTRQQQQTLTSTGVDYANSSSSLNNYVNFGSRISG